MKWIWIGLGIILFFCLVFFNQIIAALKQGKHQDNLVKRGVVQEIPLGIDESALKTDRNKLKEVYTRTPGWREKAIAWSLMPLGLFCYLLWAAYETFIRPKLNEPNQ